MNIVISLNIKIMLELIDTFRGRETSQTRLSRIREISLSYKLRSKSIFFPLREWIIANINQSTWLRRRNFLPDSSWYKSKFFILVMSIGSVNHREFVTRCFFLITNVQHASQLDPNPKLQTQMKSERLWTPAITEYSRLLINMFVLYCWGWSSVPKWPQSIKHV